VTLFVSLLNEILKAKVTESGLIGPLAIAKAILRKMPQGVLTG
jgi:hypothetical protein